MKKLSLSVSVESRSGGVEICATAGDWEYTANARGSVQQWPQKEAEKFVRSNPGRFRSIHDGQPPLTEIIGLV